MKAIKVILFAILLSSVSLFALGQSGFSSGRYYQQRYRINDIAVSYTYPKYGYHGEYLGTFQKWKRARWYDDRGGSFVYLWGPRGWYRQWYEGRYWWFDWVIYERRIS